MIPAKTAKAMTQPATAALSGGPCGIKWVLATDASGRWLKGCWALLGCWIVTLAALDSMKTSFGSIWSTKRMKKKKSRSRWVKQSRLFQEISLWCTDVAKRNGSGKGQGDWWLLGKYAGWAGKAGASDSLGIEAIDKRRSIGLSEFIFRRVAYIQE